MVQVSDMALKDIILVCALAVPSVVPIGVEGGAQKQHPKAAQWNDPKDLDTRVLDEARILYGQGKSLYDLAEDKKKQKKFKDARTAAEMAVVFLNDAEQKLLELEKQTAAPSIDWQLAEIYTLRDMQSSYERKSDHELAVHRWEKFLETLRTDPNNAFYRECKQRLLICRYSVASSKLNSGQVLSNFGSDPEKTDIAKRVFGVETAEEAYARATKAFIAALPHLKILTLERPEEPALWQMLGTCYFKLGDMPEALNAVREYVSRVPGDVNGYRALVNVYLEQKRLWQILDEAFRIRYASARQNIAKASAFVLDEIRDKTGLLPVFKIMSNEEAKGLSDLFYEMSAVRRDAEKQSSTPDYLRAIADLIMAGATEFSIAVKNNDDTMRTRVLRKVIELYDAIGDKRPLDEIFKQLVFDDRSIRIPQDKIANSFYEGLKSMKRE